MKTFFALVAVTAAALALSGPALGSGGHGGHGGGHGGHGGGHGGGHVSHGGHGGHYVGHYGLSAHHHYSAVHLGSLGHHHYRYYSIPLTYSSSYWYPRSNGCYSGYPSYGYPTYSYPSYGYQYQPSSNPAMMYTVPNAQPLPPPRVEPAPQPASPAVPQAVPNSESTRGAEEPFLLTALRATGDGNSVRAPGGGQTVASTPLATAPNSGLAATPELGPELATPKVRRVISDEEAPWVAQ